MPCLAASIPSMMGVSSTHTHPQADDLPFGQTDSHPLRRHDEQGIFQL